MPFVPRRAPRRLATVAALSLAVAGTAVALAAPASAASPDVDISQVYGGGGNSGATYTNDYIELYNRGSAAVDLSSWSVQYASSTGSGFQVTALTGSIQPGKHYLVQEAQGTGGTTALPTPDATGTIALASTSGKVALVPSTTALSCASSCAGSSDVRDFVGYGSANDAEGSPTAALTNTTADLRAGDGATDTDNNAADFTQGDPAPTNSGGTGGGGGGGGGTPVTGLQIHDVQGASHVSPYVGKLVGDVPGVVTAVASNEFWMQDATPDDDVATSEGIVVFTGNAPTVKVGDAVTVTGTVTEYRPGGSSTANLATTELSSPTVTTTGTAPVPAATLVGRGGRVPPGKVIDNTSTTTVEARTTFDPSTQGIDFWESLEGMRVELDNAAVVGPTNSYGETSVVPQGSTTRTVRGGIIAKANDFNPERIVVTDTLASVPTANVGDNFAGAMIGVIDYNFGNFDLLPTSSPKLRDAHLQRESTQPPASTQLAVATFNVENLAPSDPQTKFDTLADYAVNNLQAPDVLALEEIQDNDGATNDGVVAADQTISKLTTAIQAAGGPSYASASIDPVNDQDGGQPGGNIRNVFLYRTDRGLHFVSRPGGSATTGDSVTTDSSGAPHLLYSPGRIAPTNPAWDSSRKPLAAEFTFFGKTVFVIANHFDSKGGDDPLYGRYQPPSFPSEVQRHQQATLVHQFVNRIEKVDAHADVVVVGDLNDFQFSTTAHILTRGNALLDLIDTLPIAEQYTYVYQGNSEVLDHILISPNLAAGQYDYDVVHVNSEFSDQISDHDPQVVRLTLA